MSQARRSCKRREQSGGTGWSGSSARPRAKRSSTMTTGWGDLGTLTRAVVVSHSGTDSCLPVSSSACPEVPGSCKRRSKRRWMDGRDGPTMDNDRSSGHVAALRQTGSIRRGGRRSPGEALCRRQRRPRCRARSLSEHARATLARDAGRVPLSAAARRAPRQRSRPAEPPARLRPAAAPRHLRDHHHAPTRLPPLPDRAARPRSSPSTAPRSRWPSATRRSPTPTCWSAPTSWPAPA